MRWDNSSEGSSTSESTKPIKTEDEYFFHTRKMEPTCVHTLRWRDLCRVIMESRYFYCLWKMPLRMRTIYEDPFDTPYEESKPLYKRLYRKAKRAYRATCTKAKRKVAYLVAGDLGHIYLDGPAWEGFSWNKPREATSPPQPHWDAQRESQAEREARRERREARRERRRAEEQARQAERKTAETVERAVDSSATPPCALSTPPDTPPRAPRGTWMRTKRQAEEVDEARREAEHRRRAAVEAYTHHTVQVLCISVLFVCLLFVVVNQTPRKPQHTQTCIHTYLF
eukprot:Rmarinus@m.28993